jgi:hypothetical protein
LSQVSDGSGLKSGARLARHPTNSAGGHYKPARTPCAIALRARHAPDGRGAQDPKRRSRSRLTFGNADDYWRSSELGPEIAQYLRGKTVLEYGPGDFPGVALVLVAYGAEKVYCVDRFPLLAVTAKNSRVLDRLIAGLPENARERLLRCFVSPGMPGSGFATDRIEYLIRPSGLSGLVRSIS